MSTREFAMRPRVGQPTGEVTQRSADPGSAARVALRSTVTPSGLRVGSVAWRSRRRMLRRHLARCRAMAVLCAVLMVGAFAADRPVAGVLASMLVFMLLRAAAETRAEL